MKYQIKSVSKHLLTGAVAFFVIGVAGVLILSQYLFKAKQFPVPYLLPASFCSGQVNNFGLDKILIRGTGRTYNFLSTVMEVINNYEHCHIK